MAQNTKPLPPLTEDDRRAIDAIKVDFAEKNKAIQDAEERLRKAQADLDAAHMAASQSAADLINATGPDGALKVASVIYWTFDSTDIRRGIASALGLEPSAVIWHIYKVTLSGICPKCGGESRIVARSWSQIREGNAWCDSCKTEAIALAEAAQKRFAQSSREREEEQRRLRAMPYAEYLKTDHWQEVRSAAIKRAKFRCQTCNASKPLQVHHRTYERRGCELATDVIALCGDCHKTFHENGKLARGAE